MSKRGRKPPHPSELPSLGSSDDDITSGDCTHSKRSCSENEDDLSLPRKKTKQSANPALTKNLQGIQPAKKPNMKELVSMWNHSSRIGKVSETARGWLHKTTKRRDEQNQLLRCACPGTIAL